MMKPTDDPLNQITDIDSTALDDDDNANDSSSDDELFQESSNESPLLLALDDLESRVVTALNEFKSHSGRASQPKTSSTSGVSIHEELASILRPVVEIASHVGPSTARALGANYPHLLTVEMCMDEIYTRVNSELILPVVLESAQSDMIPAKRAAALGMFHNLYKEWQKAGSYLDTTVHPNSSLAGPYGPGVTSGDVQPRGPALPAAEASRRTNLRSLRKSELLRRWVQSAIPNLAPGTFTSASLETSAAGRGVLSASAALKPCLKYMAERIGNADDAGALRLFLPVMRMIEGVLGRLFLERARGGGDGMDGMGGGRKGADGDALRSSCIKFLEIVVLCFSNKALPGAAGSQAARMKKDASHANDFSLEDLPPGHPIITRENLEEIGEYSFQTLRGLVLLGGQAKIDPNLLLAAAASSSMGGGSDFMGGGSSPFQQILSIIKPAALAFIKIESTAEKQMAEAEDNIFKIDRSTIELDFELSQKSYSLSINAVQMLATKRPLFFKDSSSCLARRTMDPPGGTSGEAVGLLSKAGVTGIRTHLRSSCLTLLRHFLSVTSGCWEILSEALTSAGMKAQADRALQASRQQLNLMKGGRAARNRAAIFYEWDQSADLSRAEKRQRDTDDAEARVRAAKIARGLGSGVQLPTSMVDACELVLLNLKNIPLKRPPVSSTAQRKRPIDLDFVVDAVVTNGASLAIDESHWYDRDGGDAWTMEEGGVGVDGRRSLTYNLNDKMIEAAKKTTQKTELEESERTFVEQSKLAASKAFSRVLLSSSNARSGAVAGLGKQLAARLAWTLRDINPSSEIDNAYTMAIESTKEGMKKKTIFEDNMKGSLEFASNYPLVSSCLAYDLLPRMQNGRSLTAAQKEDNGSSTVGPSTTSLSMRVLNEAYVSSFDSVDDPEPSKNYENCLDVFVSSVVNACDIANKKTNDNERKGIANHAASSLSQQLAAAPSVTPSALSLVCALCDIDEVSKKSVKTAKQTIAESAAAHATKAAADKRATQALLILRDVAFQRDAMRQSAVDCAVSIATGRLPGSQQIEEKALKLVSNVIFAKNSHCADKVVESATKELEEAAQYSIENNENITKANENNAKKKVGQAMKSPFLPQSEEEKLALERVKKPVFLFMALCVRRPDIIKTLLETCCQEGAAVLAKAAKANMPKLAKAVSAKHGAANMAMKVSDMANDNEVDMLLSFLDNLAPATEKSLPSQDLIDACHSIQEARKGNDGKPDARYIIPIVSGMKREELVHKLPEFVRASDDIFKLSLHRMSERLARHALIFRLEPDQAETTLRGMSSCEQMVYLHHLDFNAVGLPQKRYLDAIRLCLEDDDVFSDRVVQAALDHMSGKFLKGEPLPLAYMRTIILTCSKHESLHSWICHVLLPRLVEGKVYNDKRQWEGWMRCAKMLENTGDHGVSSLEAVQALPEEQLRMYKTKSSRKS